MIFLQEDEKIQKKVLLRIFVKPNQANPKPRMMVEIVVVVVVAGSSFMFCICG